MTVPRRPPMAWAPWANFAIGVALVVTSYCATSYESYFLSSSNMATGFVILVSALLGFASSREMVAPFPEWVNVVAGFWLIISSGAAYLPMQMQENIILGALCVIVALVATHEHYTSLRMRGLPTA